MAKTTAKRIALTISSKPQEEYKRRKVFQPPKIIKSNQSWRFSTPGTDPSTKKNSNTPKIKLSKDFQVKEDEMKFCSIIISNLKTYQVLHVVNSKKKNKFDFLENLRISSKFRVFHEKQLKSLLLSLQKSNQMILWGDKSVESTPTPPPQL